MAPSILNCETACVSEKEGLIALAIFRFPCLSHGALVQFGWNSLTN